MARIRSIKPGFFRSEDVSALPLRARLTWIGLWTQCDDQGRTKDNPRLIKGDIWPLDEVSLSDIEEDLAELAHHGRILRYEVEGKRYLEVANWSEHQKIDRPSKSLIPPPASNMSRDRGPRSGQSPAGQCAPEPREAVAPELSTGPRVVLDESSTKARAGKGGEGKGEEGTRERARDVEPSTNPQPPEPPPKCPKHLETADPPSCRDCRDARIANDAWHTARNRRAAAAPRCRQHRGQPAHNCALCASEAKGAA